MITLLTVRSFFKPLVSSGLLMLLMSQHSLAEAPLTQPLNAASTSTTLLDSIVVIVDDDVILNSELTARLEAIKASIKSKNQTIPDEAKLQREVLDQLILESIQVQKARRAGVRISDEELNATVARIAENNGLSPIAFKNKLEQEGASYTEFREQMRQNLILQRVQGGHVNRRIQISDQEIENFLNSEEGKQLTAPQYQLLHALLPLPSSASASEELKASQYAESLYQRINNGAAFLAAVGEGGPYQISSGDLGWRKITDMPSLFADIVPTLKIGQIAKPIRSGSGYHLIQLADKRGDGELIPQTHAQHILLKPSAIRDEAATQLAVAALRKRILAGEDFGQLAREYSEDIGTASEGGDLNWTTNGQLVPAFQKAMDDTAIDAVSPPFRSQYGWHLVKVLERREKDVTSDLRHRIASNYLHDRKFQDELQLWLQEIRDEAYIDYK